MKFVSRLVKQSHDGKPRPVIVKFVSRLVKQSRRETKASNREICIMAGKTEVKGKISTIEKLSCSFTPIVYYLKLPIYVNLGYLSSSPTVGHMKQLNSI